MKISQVIFLTLFIIGIASCNSPNIKDDNTSSSNTTNYELDLLNADTALSSTDNCTRGVARPILKNSFFPNSTFRLLADSISGIESTSLKNGDRLIIKNWGCEYYTLTFRFITSKHSGNTANLEYWYPVAYKLMAQIIDGLDEPKAIREGLGALNDYFHENRMNLEIAKKIEFGENEIITTVCLDKIEKLENNKYLVQISFSTGPL